MRVRVLFWSSIISMPASSAATVVVLSRVHGEGELARISVVFALGLVWTVLPIAVQAGSASDVTAGRGVPRPPWRPTIALSVAGLTAAVPAAVVLDVPVAATALPTLALLPLVGVSAVRGRLIGDRRFAVTAANNYTETAVRMTLGIGLGVPFGATGVAITIAAAGTMAWVAAPRLHPTAGPLRLPAALGATTAITLSVQGPLILAPRVLGDGADAFVTAALPAQAIYMGLSAVAWLTVPHTLDRVTFAASIRPVVLTVAAGVAGALVLVAAAPMIGRVMDRPEPSRAVLLLVGCGMAFAAGHWVLLQNRLVRGRRRIALPPVVAAVVLVASVPIATAAAMAVAVLVGQALALGISVRGLRRDLAEERYDGALAAEVAPVLP
jgi:hypothetical protein